MASNIFDNMGDDNREFVANTNANRNEGTFKVCFATESVDVSWRAGLTVRDAFTMNADFLGFDPDRVLTYRDGDNNVLGGQEAPVVGATYMASITHDEKG